MIFKGDSIAVRHPSGWWGNISLRSCLLAAGIVLSFSVTGSAYSAASGGSDFSYGDVPPAGIIDYLKRQRVMPCPTVAVPNASPSWLRDMNIAELIPLLASEEACANVHSVYSSYRDCRMSTVGREAAFLIEGFRLGRYPPEMNSGNARLGVQVIEQWWGEYQKELLNVR
ncbi:hypothetical protein [Desulfosediminicola ganghwensis]|uniref:hypothetical protein n=1 Tax=Desulfosediminicola ganghwensis TaxID=2569540 RepID=UPI0010AD865B|nr:hypothetical protein [Desulfosediminicola ganghwensis]